jgi:thiol-disulfide isomerase/thioredoxin
MLLAGLSATLIASPLTAAPAPPQAAGLEQILKFMDKDGDGKLSKAEAGKASWFDKVDRNRDGLITAEEIKVVSDALAGRGAGILLPGKPEEGADTSVRQGPKIVKAAERNVGRLMPDAAFTDINGKSGQLSNFKSGPALVIAFTSTTCPIAKKFAPTLAALEKEFAGKGVKFLFVNPTASDSADSIKSLIKDQALAGRYVHDRQGALARALGAETTTEVFVLDSARTLVYRGALDDQYGLGFSHDAPRQNFLRDALVATLARKEPTVAATQAPGCALETQPAKALTTQVTYHNQISRIVQNNCLECHRTGGVAPFSLATYEEVKSHAGMIRKQVEREVMPPWFAAPAKDSTHSPWLNDRSLTAQDKSDLLAWLASDKPVGNPAEAPIARVYPTGWEIGQPDLVVQLPQPVQIKATGTMPYQNVRVETTLTEDKWVQGYEIIPTDREVVHHVIVRVAEKGKKKGDGDERDGFFAAYVPGNTHALFPDGFAKKLPAGATVSFQIHYTPSGKATTDQLKFGMIFAKEPPHHTIHVAGLANALINIPPGAPNHLETTQITLPFDTTILSLLPHFHLRGKAARYEAKLPDGTERILLDVPRYDFNWQLKYAFAEPVTLPRGTTLTFSAWYDNSTGNPANPDATKPVRWGQQTFEEMMLGYVEYYIPTQTKLAKAKPATP